MSIQKNKVLIFLLLFAFFYSCAENRQETVNKNEAEETVRNKIAVISSTPDSLRSSEDKLLMQQLEALMYEGCLLENGRINIIVNREELKTRGIPEIYYDMMKKDVDDINAYLDTTSFSEQIVDGLLMSQKEYFAKKEIQQEK